MSRHVHNLSFNPITDELVDALSRSGVVRSDDTWDDESALPFVTNGTAPEEIRRLIFSAVEECDIVQGDIVIVSGVPDITYYVAQAVPDDATVLAVVGKYNRDKKGEFSVYAIREVIRDPDKQELKAIHFSA